MKLLTKINKNYFKYGLIVFFIADLIIISMISQIQKLDTEQELRYGAMEVAKIIKVHGHFPEIQPTYSVKIIDIQDSVPGLFKDTIMFDPEDQTMDEFREYQFSQKINGTNYLIVHRHFAESFWELFIDITPIISIFLGSIFLVMMYYNKYMSESLWKDFKDNLDTLKSYSFTSKERLQLQTTNVDEFDDLNRVLIKMSDRLGKDYQASKEFSANAAHELQTPLAVIRTKCESLFSKDDLSSDTIQSIREIFVSTDRLSGITKALLLLAKIDHGQFNEEKKICLKSIISDKINFYREIIEDRNLNVKFTSENDCVVYMDKRLVLLWIQNVLVNAIKHSPNHKDLEIELKKNQLVFSNYGEEKIKNPDQIFKRFYKESDGKESTGIGLAIVKKITDHYNMQINYSFKNFKHTFTFQFPAC
ncbi:sensor histidine kinase [Marinifilum flexuosum]|uniref:histidine kinase n=1 Tax=Marinifilum flexuosum TaxID=1117708 RepID=A0A419X624_9BACT|nr:HAMP domain-containing sensor histidine kinase [Marinifilum flexuosum]RKE03177.1 hypothetical protein BXY64_0168 [Marinifilum flexuosum]